MKYTRFPAENGQSLNPAVFVTLLKRRTFGSGVTGSANNMRRTEASATRAINPKPQASFLRTEVGDEDLTLAWDSLVDPEMSWRRRRFRSARRSRAVW